MIQRCLIVLFASCLFFNFNVQAKGKASEKIKILKKAKKPGRYFAKYKSSDSLSKGDVIYLFKKKKKVATVNILKVKGKKIVIKVKKTKKSAKLKGTYRFTRGKSSKKLYFGGGLSYNMFSYGKRSYDSSTSRIPFGLQGGVYYNFFSSNLIGVVASFDMDLITQEKLGTEEATTYIHMEAAIATKHFFSRKIGKGVFVGGGVGFGGLQGKVEDGSSSTVTKLELGPSFFAEGGFGLKAGKLSIQPFAGYNYKMINSQGYGIIKLGVNLMY